MLASACAKNGITDEQHLFNVDVRGNQGATGAPTVLSDNWHRYQKGDLVVVAVVGSGLTWGAALFRKV
jgi:3-oxoacyl-[acyl-carrier-protein] synthase-3